MSTTAEVRAATAAALAAAQAAHDAALALPDDPIVSPEPPDPAPPERARFGIYPGAQTRDPITKAPVWPAKIATFETSTGIDVVQVGGNQDQIYDGARGSVAGIATSEAPVRTLCLAIQLAFTGGPYGTTQGKTRGAVKRAALAATVAGKNDDVYAANVRALLASPFEEIVLRLGSEGDIAWPPHSFAPGTETGAKANDDVYRDAWAHVRQIFASALRDRVRFSYTTTMFAAEKQIVCADGKTRTAIEAGYPGDALVDYVGIDCYLGQPLSTVRRLVTAGLTWAERKGKPAVLDEWGINAEGQTRPADEQCGFIRWVETLPLDYASFFAGWQGSTYPDDYSPAARACLKDAWS